MACKKIQSSPDDGWKGEEDFFLMRIGKCIFCYSYFYYSLGNHFWWHCYLKVLCTVSILNFIPTMHKTFNPSFRENASVSKKDLVHPPSPRSPPQIMLYSMVRLAYLGLAKVGQKNRAVWLYSTEHQYC